MLCYRHRGWNTAPWGMELFDLRVNVLPLEGLRAASGRARAATGREQSFALFEVAGRTAV